MQFLPPPFPSAVVTHPQVDARTQQSTRSRRAVVTLKLSHIATAAAQVYPSRVVTKSFPSPFPPPFAPPFAAALCVAAALCATTFCAIALSATFCVAIFIAFCVAF
jgi:hypothetical protein